MKGQQAQNGSRDQKGQSSRCLSKMDDWEIIQTILYMRVQKE
jgi:hypothetical protein